MSTVIDELIVVLGLDTRKFTEGQKTALESFKKGKDAALDFGRDIEQTTNKMGDALSMARKGVLGLVGAFVGGEAAAFVGHVVQMDAATGRMATSIGTSVQNLSLWQEMVKRVGGSADSATSALSAMQNELNEIKFSNKMPDGWFSSMANQAGFNLRDTTPDEVLRKSREWIQGQLASGRFKNTGEASSFLGHLPGMNQDMINLLLDPTFGKIEQKVKEVGLATDKTVSSSQRLVDAFAAITQAMDRAVASMTPMIELLMKPINSITGADIKKAIQGDNPDGPISFTRDSLMDKLDRSLWGDYKMEDAKKRLAEGMRKQQGGGGGVDAIADAIASVESAGSGGYAARGPVTGGGDRAYGKYQIMGNNIGPWSEAALGRRVSVDEFMAHPELQDQIAKHRLKIYADKYGPQGAARAWLAGEGGMNDPSRRDSYGTNVLEYQRRFDKALGAGGAATGRNDQRSDAGNTSSTEVHIGEMHVNAPNATDADGVARDAMGAVKRQAMLNPLNTALV